LNLQDRLLSPLKPLFDDTSDPSYGHPPDRRPIKELLRYGVLAIDKPAGPTSHEVVAWVRRMLEVEKAGHSGTLDPPVTGLLPVGLEDATKALHILLLGPKEYVAVMRLHSPVGEDRLMGVIEEFTGEIYQRPPQRSSVKRVTRRRVIYELEVMEQKGRLIILRVLCQAGTYVRKLIYDMGEVLGVGATMVELRRTKVSNLTEDQHLARLHDLLAAVERWRQEGEEEALRRLILPVEVVTSTLKGVAIRDSAVDSLCHGAQLAVPGIARIDPTIQPGDRVAIYTLKGEIVALGEALMSATQVEEATRGLAVKTTRVIMRPNTYPRLWSSSKSEAAHPST
jgi:H/ACA ribonucleoprotein complex subunit 4